MNFGIPDNQLEGLEVLENLIPRPDEGSYGHANRYCFWLISSGLTA